MNCIYCNNKNVVSWSKKRKMFRCNDCKKYFTENSNIHRGVIINEQRYCLKCGKFKYTKDFHLKYGKPRSICKQCHKESNYNSRYTSKKINKTDFLLILQEQNYKCKICGAVLGSLRNSFIDHNHNTGMVRGILCPKCNNLLGMCDDKVEILENAIEYLKTNIL